MPLFDIPVESIIVPVSDRVQEATLIKQKARFVDISMPDNPAEPSVKLHIMVHMYAATAEGEYGNALNEQIHPPYAKTLVADNNTAVYFNPQDPQDPQNGAIRFIQLQQDSTALDFITRQVVELPAVENGSAWRSFLQAQAAPLALQGNFFAKVRDTASVVIRELVEHHISQADLMGRFS